MTKNKFKILLYVLSPALLFWLAWPPRDLFFLGFFAFVPLFLLEDKTRNTRGSSWLIYLSLLIWNIVISWWVGYAEFYSSIFMLLANSWLMYLPWLGYRKARRIVNDKKALLIFVSLWLSFEYLHLNWQITQFITSSKNKDLFKWMLPFLLQLQEYQKAQGDFIKAIAYDHKDIRLAYFNLGISSYRLGQKDKACEQWRKSENMGMDYINKYCN